jgi:hypothetical protein
MTISFPLHQQQDAGYSSIDFDMDSTRLVAGPHRGGNAHAGVIDRRGETFPGRGQSSRWG